MTTVLDILGRLSWPLAGPQIALAEGVGMETAPVDFNPKQFFEPDVGEPHLAAEMIQKRIVIWDSGQPIASKW